MAPRRRRRGRRARAMTSGTMKLPWAAAAFTLVEVLLTSVLTATLLAALWSLLAMYSKMFDTGQTKTEQSQLARTLLAQLSDDLHGIVQAPPAVPPMPLLVGGDSQRRDDAQLGRFQSGAGRKAPAQARRQPMPRSGEQIPRSIAVRTDGAPSSGNSSSPSPSCECRWQFKRQWRYAVSVHACNFGRNARSQPRRFGPPVCSARKTICKSTCCNRRPSIPMPMPVFRRPPTSRRPPEWPNCGPWSMPSRNFATAVERAAHVADSPRNALGIGASGRRGVPPAAVADRAARRRQLSHGHQGVPLQATATRASSPKAWRPMRRSMVSTIRRR